MKLQDKNMPFLSVVFIAGIAAFSTPNVGHADSAPETLEAFVAERLAKFDQCQMKLSIMRETDQGPRTSEVEIWVKGEKLRNDFLTQAGRATVIVTGDRYIVGYIGGDVVTGNTTEFKDIWKHFEVIHPASIGATRGSVGVFNEGKLHWVFSTTAKAGEVKKSVYDVRVSDTRDFKFPVSINIKELKQAGSFEEYMEANPNAPFKMRHMAFEAHFSNGHGGELLNYSRAFGEINAAPLQESFLENQCSVDDISGIWYPARSEWTFLINGKQVEKSIVTVQSVDFSAVDESVFTTNGLKRHE